MPAIGWQELVLSNLSPSPAQKRLALCVVLALLVGLVIAGGPLAARPLMQISAFIAAYGMAICVNDSITAALLFAQFAVLRSGALLALASGYLLTGLVAIPWMLTFPGVFAPRGLLGAGVQSTAWLYILWHAGFVLFVIAYTLLKETGPIGWFSQASIRTAILISGGSVVALVVGVTTLATAGEAFLPHLMVDSVRIANPWFYAAGPTAALSVAAIVLLWLRRRSVLDLWLMVVLCAHAIEIALISYPVPTRYSVGWYAGRVYGLLSGSLVLLILLKEITVLYARLLLAVHAQRRERDARLMTGDAVSASIAHEIRQPLSAMITQANSGLRWLDRAPPDLDEAKATLKQIVTDGYRADAVVKNIRAVFRKGKPTWTSLDVNHLVWEALALMRGDLEMHRVVVEAERNEGLPRIRGDAIQLQQVLVNLMTNAIDSMAATECEGVLRVRSGVDDSGNHVVVTVEDTGNGIDPGAVDRIFEPLFTTKAHGMGMGLSICRSIMEAHDGQLWVTAGIQRGAAFHFAVPIHPGSADTDRRGLSDHDHVDRTGDLAQP
jgi:signal transduction histidine kinase